MTDEPDETPVESYYNDNLSPQQNRAIDLMLQGDMKNKEIAEEVNVTEKTIWDWQTNNDTFRRELKMRKEQQLSEFLRRYMNVNQQALDLMELGMKNAKKKNTSQEHVETAATLVDIANKALKATGQHGEGLREYLESMNEDKQQIDITDEEKAILTELRTLGPDEMRALGGIIERYSKEELVEMSENQVVSEDGEFDE
jgi:predicted DNA-binding protein YlxM (UPF0122 family)